MTPQPPTLSEVYGIAAVLLGRIIDLPDGELSTTWGQMLAAHLRAIADDIDSRIEVADLAVRTRASADPAELEAVA